MFRLLIVLSLVLPVYVWAEESSQQNNIQVEQQEDNVFKGVFYKVWNKFRALSPKLDQQPAKRVTATAGIRGAETTTSILQPYWKGDRTGDEAFMQQVDAFAHAQSLADQGQLDEAGKAFSQFADAWPDSDLRPNAQFALAVIYGSSGKTSDSIRIFESFIQENPQHPLAADARSIIDQLK